jgi:hypothetical protein
MTFLISIIVLAVSLFLLIVSMRYGLIAAGRLDNYLSVKSNSTYDGFQLYYRIPFSIGVVPEYFYALILGYDGYYLKNWWSIKTASFISILLFIASLKSRSTVMSYYSLKIIQDNGFAALFTSGYLVNFLNIITVLYIILFIFICIESFNMHGIYAPVRILAYCILCFIMADITIITLYLIVVISIIYLIIKLIGFLFFSSRKRKKEEDEKEESAGSILSGGYREFKADLYEWEESESDKPTIELKKKKKKDVRKRPKITRKRRKPVNTNNDDIPRLHPD